MSLPRFLSDYPKEMAVVGRLLLLYGGNLEPELLETVHAVNDDFDGVVKALFRTRGETQRIAIADALARHRFHEIKLGTEFEMAIGAMQYCLKIRNQYAHCVWAGHGTVGLCYLNFEEMAVQNILVTKQFGMELSPINLGLLVEQQKYFSYASSLLSWVGKEALLRRGKEKENRSSKPKQLAKPRLHTA
jgi:hypothetical protein